MLEKRMRSPANNAEEWGRQENQQTRIRRPGSRFILKIGEVNEAVRLDPKTIATEYYFGDLQYWKLPTIAADALEDGFDGPALRRLAGLATLSRSELRDDDLRAHEIDSAFCEMGLHAPITKDQARLNLAVRSAKRALDGRSNVFDEATYFRIHLCALADPPEALSRIVNLSKEARNAPRSQWTRIEGELHLAFTDFLNIYQLQVSE